MKPRKTSKKQKIESPRNPESKTGSNIEFLILQYPTMLRGSDICFKKKSGFLKSKLIMIVRCIYSCDPTWLIMRLLLNRKLRQFIKWLVNVHRLNFSKIRLC